MFRNLLRRQAFLALLFFWASNFVFAADTSSPIYAPEPLTRPLQESVIVDGTWSDFIRFIANRGPQKVSFLGEALRVLDPQRIKRLKGFESFPKTRFNIFGYELRSMEIVRAARKLLESGASGRIVVDSSTFAEIKKPTAAQWKSWEQFQKDYFLRNNDRDGDGKVTDEEIRKVNSEHQFDRRIIKLLKEWAEEFPGKLEIVSPQLEVVPASPDFNYARLHHSKEISVQFRGRGKSEWKAPVLSMESSANPTDSCMDRRVDTTPNNLEKYFSGGEYKHIEASQGHIQFGAVFGEKLQDSEIFAALRGPREAWIQSYKDGKHFDAVPPSAIQWPRVTFDKGKSSLQAFFSEGLQAHENKPFDPLWAVTQILSRRDIKLTTFYSGQFVFTHKRFARHLRTILARHKPENFGLFVDGSQALEPYSALPDLLFAPLVHPGQGELASKSVQEFVDLPEEVNWEKDIFIYRGDIGRSQRVEDKAHLKSMYFEYVDALGVTHYVVVWGSANMSYNAGQLDADVLYLFESTDPKVAKAVRPFYESLRSDPRMVLYTEGYLERFFSENFAHHQSLYEKKYLQRWVKALQGDGHRGQLQFLLKELENAGAVSDSGEASLKLMNWHARYRQSSQVLNWQDLAMIRTITEGSQKISKTFLDEVHRLWMKDVKKRYKSGASRTLRALLKPFITSQKEFDKKTLADADDNRKALHSNCQNFLKMVRGDLTVKRKHYPVAGVRW